MERSCGGCVLYACIPYSSSLPSTMRRFAVEFLLCHKGAFITDARRCQVL